MTDKKILSYIRYISKRNLIAPSVILAVMILLLIVLPVGEVLLPRTVRNIEEIRSAADSGVSYVHLELDPPLYSGFDYISANRLAASYYYLLGNDQQDPSCVFLLLPAGSTPAEISENTSQSDNSGSESLYEANARIIRNDRTFDSFLDEYSRDIGWSKSSLSEICGGFLVSSYDYHSLIYIIVLILICLISLICLVYIIGNLIVMLDPTRHEACRRLVRFGLDADDFREIDKELAHDCIINAGSLFATWHYLIGFGSRSIYIVPLFNIVWAYKYASFNRFVKRSRMRYTLVITTSPKDTVRIPGNLKSDVDKILNFLDQDFSHITVGYSEEIREQIESMDL